MNMLELLNPVYESLDWDGGHRHQLQVAATGGGHTAAVGAGGAEAAAMSLMLLGQDENPSSAEKTAVVTPLPTTTLCFSNLHIAAGPSADDAHAFTEGLRTPLPAGVATSQLLGTSSAGNISSTNTTSFLAATLSAPHLSPVADKLHHIGSWNSPDAEMSSHAQQQHPNVQQFEQSKRPRFERLTARLPNKIEDLFLESQAQQPQPIARDGESCTDEAAVDDTRCDEQDEQHQREDSCPLTATTMGHYCAVTGCLRVAQHMEKCAVHKGMKLCCMSSCFRPVQSRGFCKSHGGGARCKHPGCKKGAISKGRCRTHGGGTRCAIPSCSKWAQRFGCCVRHSKAFAATAAATAIAAQLM